MCCLTIVCKNVPLLNDHFQGSLSSVLSNLMRRPPIWPEPHAQARERSSLIYPAGGIRSDGRLRRIRGYEEGSNHHVFTQGTPLRRRLPVQRCPNAGAGGWCWLVLFELRILRQGNYRSLFTNGRLSLPVCQTERLGKVIGNSKFSNLEDFLITYYIVKISSLLLDNSSTTRGEPLYLYSDLHHFSFLINCVTCNPFASFKTMPTLFDPKNNCPTSTQSVS